MLPWLREKIATRKQRWLRPRNEEIKPQSESDDDTKESDSFFTSSTLQLKIISSHGIFYLQTSFFDSGLQLKEKIIKKLEASNSPSSSFSDDINCYKLVRSSTKRPFRDYDSILGSNVKDLEEFLLISKRPDSSIDNHLKVYNTKGPTEKEILSKTRHLQLIRSSSANTHLGTDSSFFQGDLQHDLRKILSEIAKYSAYVLGSLPFAEKLIKYYRQKILMSLSNHQEIVKLLMDMGFSHENVLRALKIHNRDYALALDWLIENDSTSRVIEGGSSLDISVDNIDDFNESTYKKLCKTIFPSASSIFYPKHKAISIKEKVEGLLEIVRYYSEKNEEANGLQDTVNTLINLGFAMEEIQEALRVSNNNQIAACEWLLDHSSSSQNSNALRESIFVESHIIKVLLLTPQIQMSLSSPKFFIAYCSMLENYSSLNIFFNDIESQSLLQLILRTYHEERIYFHTFSNPLSS